MKDFYINSIREKKKGNMRVFDKTLIELFGKSLIWSDVKKLESDKQIKLMVTLDKNIKIEKSIFDVKKLAIAIQNSRSGAGGCAMTEFECAFCKEKEIWSNTAVPRICRNCAEKMAVNFILMNYEILK